MALKPPKLTFEIKRVIQTADVEVPEDIENTMIRALGKMLFQGFPSKIDA